MQIERLGAFFLFYSVALYIVGGCCVLPLAQRYMILGGALYVFGIPLQGGLFKAVLKIAEFVRERFGKEDRHGVIPR